MGSKRSKKKQRNKEIKQPVIEQEEEEQDVIAPTQQREDFDLEAMETFLANDENDNTEDDGDKDSADEDFMENDDNVENTIENDDDMDKDEEYDNDYSHAHYEESGETEIEEDSEEKENDEENDDTSHERSSIAVEGNENCTLDLRNLMAINSHQINHRSLYNQTKSKSEVEDEVTICVSGLKRANEDYLLQKASEGCSQLLAGLWELETEKTDAGPMATLPKYFEIITPRELVSISGTGSFQI